MSARVALAAAAASLSLLAASTAHAAPNVDLDGLFTYGLGNGHALGASVQGFASLPLWRSSRALGTLELGASAGYINEPIALQPWNANTATTGTTHRVPLAVSVGHAFRFGQGDRWSFGVHAYAGGVYWHSAYNVRFVSRGIEGTGVATSFVPDVGFFLRSTFRPHPMVGLALQLGAPVFGVAPETVVGLFTLGFGVTVRLR